MTEPEEWRCAKCDMEIGAFELWDGTLVGYFCIRTALREAETQLIEGAFDEHLTLGDFER